MTQTHTQPLTLQLLIRDYANVKKARAQKRLTRIIKLERRSAVETQTPHRSARCPTGKVCDLLVEKNKYNNKKLKLYSCELNG